jgi:hypothetical protein
LSLPVVSNGDTENQKQLFDGYANSCSRSLKGFFAKNNSHNE